MLKLAEVLVALALTYLLFAMLCSAAAEALASSLKMRAAFLRQGLLRLLGAAPDKAGKAGSDAFGVLDHPWIAGLCLHPKEFPPCIEPRRFADAMVQQIAAQLGSRDVLAADSRSGYRQLRSAVHALPDDSQHRRLLAPLFVEDASTMEELRGRVESWFEQQMERVSGWYKRWVQRYMLVIGLLLAALFNVDSIALFKTYWENAKLREAAASAAANLSDMEHSQKEAKTMLERLKGEGLPIGWGPRADPAAQEKDAAPLMPRQPHPLDLSAVQWLVKLLGFLLTAAAVVPGAQFWFDGMVRLLDLRAADGKRRADADGGAAGTAKASP